MSPTEIVLNFGISIAAGMITGTFLATKGRSNPETELTLWHAVVTWRRSYSRKNLGDKIEWSPDATTWLVAVFFALIVANVLLSKYQTQIIQLGWVLLTFFASSILSSLVLTLLRDRTINKFNLWSFWSLSCILVSGYIFYLFCVSLNEPTYSAYLQSVRAKGFYAFSLDHLGLLPVYQFLGLVAMAIAILIAFLQSTAVLVRPMAFDNRLLFSFVRRTVRFFHPGVMAMQVLLLLGAYLAISGKLISWLFR